MVYKKTISYGPDFTDAECTHLSKEVITFFWETMTLNPVCGLQRSDYF